MLELLIYSGLENHGGQTNLSLTAAGIWRTHNHDLSPSVFWSKLGTVHIYWHVCIFILNKGCLASIWLLSERSFCNSSQFDDQYTLNDQWSGALRVRNVISRANSCKDCRWSLLDQHEAFQNYLHLMNTSLEVTDDWYRQPPRLGLGTLENRPHGGRVHAPMFNCAPLNPVEKRSH